MLNTTQDLKEFILWAKEAGIEAFKVGQVEVKFSPLAIVSAMPEIEQSPVENRQTEEKNTSKTLVDTETGDDEDLLYWSSKP